jgi:death-on-curing protein
VILYLSFEQILDLHAFQIERYGGSGGLRDRGAVESAAARPAMTFGGEDLYGDLAAKAAALMHSLVMNHAFVDGNKRVGAHAALVFILINGHEPTMTPKELEETALAVARGEMDVEPLTIWFRQRLVRRD